MISRGNGLGASAMYLGVILLTMVTLPVLSVAAELLLHGGALAPLIGKWFVFWGIGVRVMLAAARQMLQPQFTADMLQIKDPRAHIVVRELGFANASIALLALLALPWPSFLVPAAIAGTLFLGLAGIQHAAQAERGAKENIAMVSDLGLAAILAVYLAGTLI